MSFSKDLSEKIAQYFKSVLDNTIRFVFESDNNGKELILNPFYTRLLPDKIWKSTKIERSFVTAMRNEVYEEITKLVGEETWGSATRAESTEITIYQKQFDKIHSMLNELDHKLEVGIKASREPNWKNETNLLKALQEGKTVTTTITSDVFLYDGKNNMSAFIELKSPEPDKNQSKVSKEKMLKLFCHFNRLDKLDNVQILFALPYNPYPSRAEYAHPFPKAYFDMISGSEVKIGDKFWEMVGKDKDTYNNLLEVAAQVGKEYKVKLDELFKDI